MNGLAARIEALAERQPSTGTTDGQLLDEWVKHRDHDAFRQLVLRHGPMILGTCRRLLGDGPAAEDAFQVTLLVLLKQAARLIHHDTLGGYLHGVARRTAMKARTLAARRAKHEARMVPRPMTPPVEALDDALAKLPEKYRVPVVLCELEGHTRAEAARLLGIPVGTVSSRLATAHKMLTKKLCAFALPAAVLLPTSLLNAAMRLPAGVPVALAPLFHEVTRMTFFKKLTAGLATATLATLVLGAGSPADAPKPTEKPTAKEPAKAKTDSEKLAGYWRVDGTGDFRKGLFFHFGTDGLLHTTAPDEDKKDTSLTQQSRFALDDAKKQLAITTKHPLMGSSKLEGKYDISADKLELHVNANGSLGILKLQRVPDKDVLQGVWQYTKAETAGQAEPISANGVIGNMVFDGDKFSMLENGGVSVPFKLDETTSPKTLRVTLPKDEGDKQKGKESGFIYEIRNNELILCGGRDKQSEAPKDFKPTAENDNVLLTLRYVGPVPAKKK
jgi:uncharacterized protein (TIGR03067 family)